jgi:sugar phosphate isomerase/epimerase
MKLGAQFYTLRDFCKDLNGLEESMKKVADMGYTSIQLPGVCAYEGEWAAEKAKENGLTVDITHFAYGKIINETEATIKHHDAMNCKCIGIGASPYDKTLEGFTRMADEIAQVIPKINASGHKLMYHNHHFEFGKENGKTYLEHLCERFTPEELGITLDTYWVQTAGGDPAQWLEELSGRVPCIHLTDHSFDRKMAAVGEGNINFDAVFKAAEKAGTKYMLVEQDDCNGEDPFECLKRSYNNLKALGFK